MNQPDQNSQQQEPKLHPALQSVLDAENRFLEINKQVGAVSWESEQMFAMQSLKKNDFIWNIATRNPQSVRSAVVNIAAIGLSLNPATKYAYLVPRDNQICLDISYQGLIKLATDTGAVRWAKADIVRENDTYIYKGVGEKPEHSYGMGNSLTADRGKVVGGYCIAKTCDGDYLCEQMTIEEINKIRDASKAYQAYVQGKAKQCPWVDWEEEMQKKTLIKRASKTWPKSERAERLQTAIDVINQHEGIDFEEEKPTEPVVVISEEMEADLTAYIEEKGIAVERLLKYFKINELKSLPQEKYDEAIKFVEMADGNSIS